MEEGHLPSYRKDWNSAVQYRRINRTNVPIFIDNVQAIGALIDFLEWYYDEFRDFAKTPPDPIDLQFTSKIQDLYVSLEEFRSFLVFYVVETLYDWDSVEWQPVLEMLETLSTAEEFSESWGLISALWADLERGTIYNRNKFFVALNWIRVLCREIKKASVNLEKTKLQWKSRGF